MVVDHSTRRTYGLRLASSLPVMAFSERSSEEEGKEGDEGKGKAGEEGASGKEGERQQDRNDGTKLPSTQEELDDLITRRLERDRRSNRGDLRDEVRKEIEQEIRDEEAKAQGDYKTLYEKAKEKLDDYDRKASAAELSERKRKIAKEVGFDAEKIDDIVDRIHGEDDDELKKDAKKLLELIGPSKEAEDIDTGESRNQRRKGKGKGNDDTSAYEDPTFWGIGS